MDKPGKKAERCSTKDSRAVELRIVQEEEETKRKQIEHRTLRILICAVALSPESTKAILLSLISRWM